MIPTSIISPEPSLYHIDHYPAKIIYLNFQPLEVVDRYRDPQPQVVENYPYVCLI